MTEQWKESEEKGRTGEMETPIKMQPRKEYIKIRGANEHKKYRRGYTAQ